MSTGSQSPRPTRNQQREAARAKAKAQREQQAKKDKRNKWMLQSGIAVGIIAIVAVVGLTIANSVPKPGPRPANMASDGIVLSGAGMKAVTNDALPDGADPVPTVTDPASKAVHIVVYEDYLCPACKAFDSANAEQLQTLVNAGAATLEIHPIGMLWQRSAGTEYSRRSAAAAACVATYSPNTYWAVNQAFYDQQPQEGTAGLTDDEIKKLIASAGAGDTASINSCIDQKTFIPWVKAATDRALKGPMTDAATAAGNAGAGTPTVLVNGKVYTGSITDAKAFLAFVTQVAGTPDSTPTPSPSPSKA
jgi:protein-disulfide isomerase